MSIFNKSWWHHHIKKWKSVGDVLGITQKTNKVEKQVGKKAEQIADHANKDIGGDPRLDGGYSHNAGTTVGQSIGRSVADAEGDDE